MSLSQNVFAQYKQEWVARYNNQYNSRDGGNYLAVDKSGNVTVAGESGHRYLTVRYDPNGNQLWSAIYNQSYPIPFDNINALVLDSYGNAYVTGESKGPTYFYMDYATIKYDLNGDQSWVDIFNSSNSDHDRAYAMVIDKNNNIIVTGFSLTPCSNGNFLWNTIKYSSKGSQTWIAGYCAKNYLPLGGYAPQPALAIDSSGNVIIAGSSEDTANITNGKYSIIKYNQDGQLLWVRNNYPAWSDYCEVATDKSGNIFFVGLSLGGTILIKYSPKGDSLWSRDYSGLSLREIAVDKANNIYLAGVTYPGGFTTIKTDSNGTQKWLKIDSIGNYLNSMTTDDSGNVYVTGSTGIDINSDYYTAKYNTNGNKVWSAQYNGSSDSADVANDVVVDQIGNIYVTGISRGTGSFDMITIKYSIITNSNYNISEVIDFNLHQNFPNPFNPSTNLEFGISELGFVTLKVYNALGVEVAVLVNENKPAGNYSVQFDGANYPSGIYYYKLESGDFSEVKKMILLK